MLLNTTYLLTLREQTCTISLHWFCWSP